MASRWRLLALVVGFCGFAYAVGCSQSIEQDAPQYETAAKELAVGDKIYGRQYEFDVVAMAGSNGIRNIIVPPSINGQGSVAFVASVDGGQSIFVSRLGESAPYNITPDHILADRSFIPGLDINESNQVIALDRQSSAGISNHFIRRWDGNLGADGGVVVSTLSQEKGIFQIIAKKDSTFETLFPYPTINEANQVAFAGNLTDGGTVVATATATLPDGGDNPSPTYKYRSTSGSAARLDSETDGGIVYRLGTTGPIVLNDAALNQSTTIADTTLYSPQGRLPGVSEDGFAVAFYASRTTASSGGGSVDREGAGIFVSYRDSATTRKILRVARRLVEDVGVTSALNNQDGNCDYGELCIVGELGFDFSATDPVTGRPGIPIEFASFNSEVRTNVLHFPVPPEGPENDTLVVLFGGTPTRASPMGLFSVQFGLWTVRIDFPFDESTGQLMPKVHTPIPVLQIGDSLGSRVVTSIGPEFNHQLARIALKKGEKPGTIAPGDHRVAVVATTASGNVLVRAEHRDRDQDGLLDHWELKGIDYDQNGSIDLALAGAPYGSQVSKKDLFLELDYMVGPGDADAGTYAVAKLRHPLIKGQRLHGKRAARRRVGRSVQ